MLGDFGETFHFYNRKVNLGCLKKHQVKRLKYSRYPWISSLPKEVPTFTLFNCFMVVFNKPYVDICCKLHSEMLLMQENLSSFNEFFIRDLKSNLVKRWGSLCLLLMPEFFCNARRDGIAIQFMA